MHYLLFYDVVPDDAERRAAFRGEHLAYARRAHRRGELVLGGALADPVDGAVFLSRGPSPAAYGRAAGPFIHPPLPRPLKRPDWSSGRGPGRDSEAGS
jgi:hypothetical protein